VGYQSRINLVNDENDDLFADFHSILNKWKNYFSHLLNIHGANNVKQTEMHTVEPSTPGPSSFKVEIATEKLESYKLLCTDQIPAVHQIFIDFEKVYDLVQTEVLYYIIIEYSILMKLVRLIKVC
jgi:hypothetical protein